MAMGSFSISLEAFKVKTEKQMVTACQKIAMECWKRVIMKSPVDTGRFRANWGCRVGSPYAETLDSTDKYGAQAIGKAVTVTSGWNGKGSIFLCNNLPYATVLEFGGYPNPPEVGTRVKGKAFGSIRSVGGYSYQAPGGMVRVTVSEMQNGAAEAVVK